MRGKQKWSAEEIKTGCDRKEDGERSKKKIGQKEPSWRRKRRGGEEARREEEKGGNNIREETWEGER